MARSLPGRYYTDPTILERELECIFERTWQWFGVAEHVAHPGSFITGVVGREPVVVTRDREGDLHAFSGVCRHRGGPVAEGHGQVHALRCRYHGWTYRLDGSLAHAPSMTDTAGCDLPRFSVDEWHGHLFVHLGPEPRVLADVLDPVDRWAKRYGLDELHFDHRDTYDLDCNWKTYVDNSQEGYHIAFVHPMLSTALDLRSYREECDGSATRQVAPFTVEPGARGGADDLELFRMISPPLEGLIGEETAASMFINVFPNFVVNLHPDHVVTEVIEPLDAEHSRIHLDYWFPGARSGRLGQVVRRVIATGITDAPSKPGGRLEDLTKRATAAATRTPPSSRWQHWFQSSLAPELARALNIHYTDQAQYEDVEITAAAQRGLRSPHYEAGPLSPTREDTVAHFHRLVREHLGDESG